MPRKQRDAERTRARILAAATREFAAKGFAGARVDGIATRARINKQLLYHYFGDKRALFEASVRDMLAVKARTHEAAPHDLVDLLPYTFDATGDDELWLRFMLWEALSYGEKRVPGEAVRCEGMQRGVARMRRLQDEGAIPRDAPPELVLLAMMALSTLPWAFPQVTRMLTGKGPHDTGFRRRYAALLRTIALRLRSPRSTRRPAPRR